MKIGVLGGTFDPIHLGHLMLAGAAKNQYGLDKVVFVPAFIPPNKLNRRDITPAPYRYEMVRLAIQDIPGFEISDIELSRPDISYTVDTLRSFKQQFPDAEFYLIMGEDTLQDLPRWQESEKIRDLAKILVADRESSTGAHAIKNEKDRFEGSRIRMNVCPVSSTEIRSRLLLPGSLGDLIPEKVERYIRKMNLYSQVPS